MTFYDEENDYTNIIDLAVKNQLGTQEEIKLYQQLNIALELIDDEFKIIYSDINEGINFGITTPYPNTLPESIGILFYNIDLKYDVSINEITEFDDNNFPEFGVDLSNFNIKPIERYYIIQISRN